MGTNAEGSAAGGGEGGGAMWEMKSSEKQLSGKRDEICPTRPDSACLKPQPSELCSTSKNGRRLMSLGRNAEDFCIGAT